jgi:hypothetical protein
MSSVLGKVVGSGRIGTHDTSTFSSPFWEKKPPLMDCENYKILIHAISEMISKRLLSNI